MILFFMAVIFNSYGQRRDSVITEPVGLGTTTEEFNYVTKGYKIQKESGLDMKKGYSFKALHQNLGFGYTMELKGLYRDKEKYPCAVLIELTDSGDFLNSPYTSYICVPHWNSSKSVWEQYSKSINTNNASALSWCLAKCVAFFAQNN